jgi:hypothetical protein
MVSIVKESFKFRDQEVADLEIMIMVERNARLVKDKRLHKALLKK